MEKVAPGVANQESTRSSVAKSGSGSGDSLEDSKSLGEQPDTVLVISLQGTSGSNSDPPGLLTENEVIEMQASSGIDNAELNSESDALVPPDSGTINDADSERMDKRLRFSVYSTDLSELGEGEAMSSTSGSSIEDMDQVESVPADDTSSFRGTSSHGNQDEEDENEGDLESIPHTNNDEALKALERKLPTSRESIEDKMRKFEIRSQFGVRFGGAVVAGLDSGEDRIGDGTHGSTSANYLDTRSDTWSTDAYASDSETATEHEEVAGQADLVAGQQEQNLQQIAENPDRIPEPIRSGSAGPYLALLPRDEDSRSDVWSVEVLPSDSEPPDIKPEDRLQELESESTAGAEDAIDQLEDNQSRASTPGLSAASGVSGTSGLSLVSDNIHAKVEGGEEHGSSSERSFGKTPSSISPDADDLIGNNRNMGSGHTSSRFSGGGSSHSSGSAEGINASSRPQTAPTAGHGLILEGQIQAVNYSGSQEGLPVTRNKPTTVNNLMRRSKSASPAYLSRGGPHDGKKGPVSPVTMPNGATHLNYANKEYKEKLSKKGADADKGRGDPVDEYATQGAGANFPGAYMDAGSNSSPLSGSKPEAASTPDDTGNDVIMQSSHQTNTIKRSPYKQNESFGNERVSAFNSVPSSLARDIAADATQLEMAGAPSGTQGTLSYYNLSTTCSSDPPPENGKVDIGAFGNHIKSNGTLPQTVRSIQTAPPVTTSTFVPITSGVTYSPSPPLVYHDISSFDPLAKDPSDDATPQVLQTKLVTSGNSLLNMNSMSAALVDLSMGSNEPNNQAPVSRGVDQQSQVPSPVNHSGARSKTGTKVSNDHALERKKSWWKSPRLPSLPSKKKTIKAISLDDPTITPQDHSSSRRDSNKPLAYLNGQDNLKSPPAKPTVVSAEPSILGEDIMQKYMRKAASNQSSPKQPHKSQVGDNGAPPLMSPDLLTSPISNPDKSVLDLESSVDKTTDSQNVNSSSNTDHHSTPSNMSSGTSDRTVTTVTQGTSPNLSLPSNEKPQKAVPVNCPGKETYQPDAAQLLSDAQRKLRLMLSTTESLPETNRFSGLSAGFGSSMFAGYRAHAFPATSGAPGSSQDNMDRLKRSEDKAREEIISFLRLQLAEAVSLQDHSRVAQIHETTRCVHALDTHGCKKVLQNLWKEYKKRSSYVAYLVRTKQALLTTSSYLQHLFNYTERDQETCRRYLTSVCVGLFFKEMDISLRNFKTSFTNSTVADEKVSLVRNFLSWLYGRMSQDPMWESTGEEQLLEAERAIERNVFVYIYKLALYPNGDGDVLRDQLYDKHLAHLAATVTPQHPALLIPEKYLKECPWPSAQAEARSVNAYKTPRDKLAAVLRCCNTIMNLLKMADEGTVPGADDFTPVLVYVLIKAKPPNLLSTIQYITSFIGDELMGEDSYWWMQFTAATEFIKTID